MNPMQYGLRLNCSGLPLLWLGDEGSSIFSTYGKFSKKLINVTRACAYQGVRSVLENFAYILNGWSLS